MKKSMKGVKQCASGSRVKLALPSQPFNLRNVVFFGNSLNRNVIRFNMMKLHMMKSQLYNRHSKILWLNPNSLRNDATIITQSKYTHEKEMFNTVIKIYHHTGYVQNSIKYTLRDDVVHLGIFSSPVHYICCSYDDAAVPYTERWRRQLVHVV